MRRFLHIDEETRELRLVVTDLADGNHERTEFRVLGQAGVLRGVERWGHMDGQRVEWDGDRFYFTPPGPLAGRVYLEIENPAIGATEKIPCPRAANRRRRCAICRAEEAGRASGGVA